MSNIEATQTIRQRESLGPAARTGPRLLGLMRRSGIRYLSRHERN